LTLARREALWLLAIALVAANLRPVITSVPPLVDSLARSVGLSAVGTGLLTTLPVVCMGLFAPVAALASRRFGEATVLAAAVAVIALGAAARALGGVAGLFAGTLTAGIGIAVAGALLPSLVRRRMPDRVGPVTGFYTAALIGGALVGAGGTEPLRAALGWSAQGVLAVWAVPALLALTMWLALPPGDQPIPTRRPPTGLPWRSGAAWLGTLFMGAQSLLFYATLAWLAATYTALGMSAHRAGLLLAVFSAAQIITALAMPAMAHRTHDVRPWIAVSVSLTVVALALVAVVPVGLLGKAAPWAWATVLGLGMGGNFSLALTVVTESAPTPEAAPAYAGMAFFVGYLVAAPGPVAAGALREATGGFTAVFLTLAALGVVTLALGLAAGRSAQDPHDHELAVVT